MLYCWGRLTDTTQDIMCKYSILLPSCRTNLIPIFCSSMDQRQEIVISWRRWLIPHQWIPVTCWCVCIIKACTNEHLELGVTPIFQQSNVRDYFSYRNIVISSLPFISLLFSTLEVRKHHRSYIMWLGAETVYYIFVCGTVGVKLGTAGQYLLAFVSWYPCYMSQ